MSIPRKGDEVTLEIAAAAFEGKAVSRIEGYVVLVEGAVPGDVALVRVVKAKKQYAEARVLKILKPSSLRTTPRCPSFGTCGGCKWQHVDYPAQLQFKQQQVRDIFERIGGFSDLAVAPIIGADDIYFYRNKMEFSFADQEWLEEPPVADSQMPTGNLKLEKGNPPVFLGLHVPRRYDKVLDIHECYLQSEESISILNFTRDFARRSGFPVYSSSLNTGYYRFLVIRQSRRTGELMVNLVTFEDRPDLMEAYAREAVKTVPAITTVVNTINDRKAQIAFGEKERVCHGPGIIHEQLSGNLFAVSASSFFQTNTAQAEKLYSVAREFAGLKSTDTVYDLYSGTGAIAMAVSKSAKQVIGIESVESAVNDAGRNARENGIENCSFVLGDLKERLTKEKEWMSSYPKADVLIIDPPRSGMHPRVVEEVRDLGASRIVYVSCNPATQARDCRALCEERYRLVKLQPVDMFPHTYHIENVVLLEPA